MEFTASALAAELKREIESKLPAKPILCGEAHRYAINVSVGSVVTTDIYFDAIGILLQQLADDYPGWKIGLEGEPDDLVIMISELAE